MRPIRELIEAEIERSETDLASFRSRSITVVTTSSGIVTLLTGVFTFAASKAEDDAGLSDWAIIVLSVALALFVAAAVLALLANRGQDVDRPASKDVERHVDKDAWTEGAGDTSGEERDVAAALLTYLISSRELSDRTAGKLNKAIFLQIAGVALTAIGGLIAMVTLN